MKTRKPGNQGLAMIRLLGFSLLAVTIAAHADEPQLPTEIGELRVSSGKRNRGNR